MRFDTFGTSTHRTLDRLFLSTTESNTLFKLTRDPFTDKVSIKVRFFDFNDVDVNLFTSQSV
jgi:hypothetical protein